MVTVVTSRPTAIRLRYDARVVQGQQRFAAHGNCQRPVEVFVRGLPDPTMVAVGMEREEASACIVDAPCRKCGPCLIRRGRLWTNRARSEIHSAERTWFGTLTLRPEEQWKASLLAQKRARVRGVEWFDDLDDAGRFQRVHAVISEEITLYLKRVRKLSQAKFRYILVAERHKSGDPHYHCLVHDYDEPIRHRVLTSSWKMGWTKFNLVEGNAPAYYVAKYLSKSSLARVRASRGYGDSTSSDIARSGQIPEKY